MIPGVVKDIEILAGTIVETHSVDCGVNAFTICGQSDSSTTMQTEFETADLSLFSVSAGTLSVSDLALVHDPTHQNNCRTRLFEISGEGEMDVSRLNISAGSALQSGTAYSTEMVCIQNGRMSMDHVKWKGMVSTVSLLSLSSTSAVSLRLSECDFDGIERTTSGSAVMSLSNGMANIDLNSSVFEGCGSTSSENGGSTMLCVGDANEVNVKDGSFNGCFCSASNGLGGGILLQLSTENPDFLISSSFGTNTAKWGNDIFAISPNLEVTAKSQKITCVTASSDSVDKVKGYDGGNNSVAIPLCIYLLSPPSEIYVSNTEASNHSHCGIVQFPCLTLKHSLTQLAGPKKIVVNGMIMMSDELVFGEQKHEIRGKDDQSGWTVSDATAGANTAMVKVGVETVLSTLIFSLPPSLSHSTFISSSSSSLTMSQCSLSIQNPSSEIAFLFLSVDSGMLTIDTFSVSSKMLSGSPLISLSGSSTEAELTSIQMNEVGTTCASGLFEVKGKASLLMRDCIISSITQSEEMASSHLISSTSAKKVEIVSCTLSNFVGKNQNGGAIECTLEDGCSFAFEEGSMSSCKSERGNGGGLWIHMKSGSSFSVGNITEALPNNGSEVEQEAKVGFSECDATANADGSKGLGGGIYLVLDDGASDFVLKSVQFIGCKGRKGKDVFLDADDLGAVANTTTFCFDVELNDFEKLNGFERSTANEEFEIPLVVYLWNNFTEPCHVGGQEAHDFSGCGFEQVPCDTITKAASLRFSGKNKSIKLNSPFFFGEELNMKTEEWSMSGEGNETNYGIAGDISGAQSGIFESHCPVSFIEVVLSLSERIGSYGSIFHCVSSTLTIQNCGIVASKNELRVSCVKVEGGEVVMNNVFGNAIGWQKSAIIVDGSGGETPSIEIVEGNFSGNGQQSGCLVESRNVRYLNMTKCEAISFVRRTGNGGSISVDNSNIENENTQINIEGNVFDGCSVMADGSRGGAIDAQIKWNTQLNIISCTFTRCTAPDEEGKIGLGGGMALTLVDGDPSFSISSPVFDNSKPNVAKYGNDLFVESSNLTKSITNASLPFVLEHMADISLDSLSGFDKSDTTNAIPLIYFWRTFGSEIFIGGNGKDVCICGLSDYPCLSIDYSLDRLLEGNERNINIIGKGILKKSVDLGDISISSNNTDMCSLECRSSIEGAEDEAMNVQGISYFELIRFVLPSSFATGVNSLIHVSSREGSLTLKDCSFAKNEERGEEDMINFGLIKADAGSVVFAFVAIQSLSFSCDIASIASAASLAFRNLTMKNIQLEGGSGLYVARALTGNENVNAEADESVVVEWSTLEEVTQSAAGNIAMFRSTGIDPTKMVIRNTTIKKCGGSGCKNGGAALFRLNEGGRFDCLFSSITDCFCSSTGRGGGLFLECTSAAAEPAAFVLSNITFKDNTAYRGRDVYVKCRSIEAQIADGQFLLDFRAPFVKDLAIWGCTSDMYLDEEDLLKRIVKYQSETVFVSSAGDNHEDSKQCGGLDGPCSTLSEGLLHVIPSLFSQLLISSRTAILSRCNVLNVTIRSLESPSPAQVFLNSTIPCGSSIITTSEKVRIESLSFSVGSSFSFSGGSLISETNGQLYLSSVLFASEVPSNSIHPIAFNSALLSVESGLLLIDNCTVLEISFEQPVFRLTGSSKVSLAKVDVKQVELSSNLFEVGECVSVVIDDAAVDGVKSRNGSVISICEDMSGVVSFGSSSIRNFSRDSFGACFLSASSPSARINLSNCSCSDCVSLSKKGSIVDVSSALVISMQMCELVGRQTISSSEESVCKWNGSLINLSHAAALMKDVTISNSSSGGLSLAAGSMTIEKGEFYDNSPSMPKYPSLRRNVFCCDSASLAIDSLKGGDGVKDNTSLWITSEDCSLKGAAQGRPSPFFIPHLESASLAESGSEANIKFIGSLFLPCDLSFKLICTINDVELVERYPFDENSFVSETEVVGTIPSAKLTSDADGSELSTAIEFGKSSASTKSFILKNRSVTQTSGDEKIVEGGKKEKSFWPIIVIVCVVFVVLLLAIVVILAVRWKKVKNEAEDLREIVNDNIRKDPKAFEMVTMEMSPEEQWRRAEREAEKKNEERIKKRIYETNMQHSESSEHLLSESGSTEYILGKDSDKIPQWALEKDEEEEKDTRKRTPSPSISSTSTTDSDSTFVRGEDLCPTTSSMSNLVDAMACSSPHEKLIVDLRDSLFMLLHGRNEKKEMAIGSLKEREQTVAQILFWVANLALHSFDEMENELSSLANLSPHIVLFSEHMVICIALHSDCSSDSDTSSISSASTMVTSSSDVSVKSERFTKSPPPSSAFEDEDDNRKECMRWKAPELLINKKLGATKESVAFSIGMMLWECLTLQIPFGEYEAEVAGQKIVNGERPIMGIAEKNPFSGCVLSCLDSNAPARPTLVGLKREFIQHFPAGAAVLTMSDAIGYAYSSSSGSRRKASGAESEGSGSGSIL
ncbi:uncharacterized protein MONOS_14320 [Monocercomonoides exilis]|uniref:uncharacterized protein n=1 Tax=Monocercomonoides exilis TaxID=2049356 RepID=UPI00355A1F94|nr:hypothetical protein MONOS_14320 [Monocercomonoides exilis]|eukprot:MONOS_14320.1-p1 / transcript=MONOS_14320.1 / gene=MONOS_14320 / organism=Monocercomonoides_exilis_PA203 / gene_product=unspecified product / transcript_product=unspecified product / location=Mono_scaffold00980:85-7467(+) / protein_length=2461 / sequence_SO=supercontig / SO=protein_coding / is_pseudo=false